MSRNASSSGFSQMAANSDASSVMDAPGQMHVRVIIEQERTEETEKEGARRNAGRQECLNPTFILRFLCSLLFNKSGRVRIRFPSQPFLGLRGAAFPSHGLPGACKCSARASSHE